jgi:NAD(P)-dependent dehydrogenase (short-subunit alcohol dehydrogenase family)
MSEQKVVLITGASSGIGRATAALLAERGFNVFGTSRKPDKIQTTGFEMLHLDVRSDESVEACVRRLMERTGRLDVLINNAAYGLMGASEETTLPQAKSLFEANFFGAVRVVNAVLPVMREQGSGQIINVSSLAGLVAWPFDGAYCATKYALEGYTESLLYEVKPFNIRVSIVEPDFFKSDFVNSMQVADEPIDDYAQMRQQAITIFEESMQRGADPIIVAKLILRIIEDESPRLRYRAGRAAIWIPRIRSIIPEGLFQAAIERHLLKGIIDYKPSIKNMVVAVFSETAKKLFWP